jgi:hypothetical protein
MNIASENAGQVALPKATAEARTLIEELTRLAEDLRVRQERLGASGPERGRLAARTEYLDKVMRDELARAEKRVLTLAEEAAAIARHVSQDVLETTARLAERDARRWDEKQRRRPLADRHLAPDDVARGLPGRPGGQLALARWRARGQGNRTRDQRVEDRAGGAAQKRGPGQEAERQDRTLSRDDISRLR